MQTITMALSILRFITAYTRVTNQEYTLAHNVKTMKNSSIPKTTPANDVTQEWMAALTAPIRKLMIKSYALTALRHTCSKRTKAMTHATAASK